MTTTQLLSSALSGLGLGLGLIAAIGAQNAFVLRQGIRHEHVLAVVLVCIGSDVVLIIAGVAGAGALFTAVPWLVVVARWCGAVFLLGYAVRAARRAWRPAGADDALRTDEATDEASGEDSGVAATPAHTEVIDGETDRATIHAPSGAAPTTLLDAPAYLRAKRRGTGSRLAPTLATALALTWLNPHVYLDTVVLLGSVGSARGDGRWAFAAGAALGSALWFTALGLAARALAPVFARPGAWRVLDGLIAVVMTGVAAGLVLGN